MAVIKIAREKERMSANKEMTIFESERIKAKERCRLFLAYTKFHLLIVGLDVN